MREEIEKELEKYAPQFDMETGYLNCISLIKENFQNMAENVVAIGFYLKHIKEKRLYLEGDYSSFADFAKGEFGLSASSASRYISINERFSIDGNSPFILEDKKVFSKSQLQEMLYLSEEQVEQVAPDMTVKEIRELATSQETEIACESEDEQLPGQLDIEFYPEVLPDGYKMQEVVERVEAVEVQTEDIPIEFEKAEVVVEGEYREIEEENFSQEMSAYGLPKTEYEEGSLIQTKGCGHKHDCFSCSAECNIRGEHRYCVSAPMGNPFECTTMNVLQLIREEIGESCQFINTELASKRAGDNMSVPCCKNCTNQCGYRCNRAVKKNTQPIDDTENVIPEEHEKESDIEFVRELLETEKETLDFYLAKDGFGEHAIRKRQIYVAALANMLCDLEEAELQKSIVEKVQPELPRLKNNDQRKEFLRNYEEWGVWYCDEKIDARYFKYDFEDGSRIVVAQFKNQYVRFKRDNESEWSGPHYHLVKSGGHFSPYDTSETELVVFLKDLQVKNMS